MPGSRAALVLLATTATVVPLLHKTHRPAHPGSASLAPVVPPAASRSEHRLPLRAVNRPPSPKVVPLRRRPAARTADVTAYCGTGQCNAAGRWPRIGDVAVLDRSIPFGTRVVIDGNVYVVRDWVGHSSDFDLYMGSDPGCEQRALDFGRRRLRVVVER